MSLRQTGQNVHTVHQSKLACSHCKVQAQLLRRSCNSRGEEAYVRMLDLQAVLPVRCQQISIVPHVPHLQSTQLVSIPIRLLQFRNVIPTHEAKETPEDNNITFLHCGGCFRSLQQHKAGWQCCCRDTYTCLVNSSTGSF